MIRSNASRDGVSLRIFAATQSDSSSRLLGETHANGRAGGRGNGEPDGGRARVCVVARGEDEGFYEMSEGDAHGHLCELLTDARARAVGEGHVPDALVSQRTVRTRGRAVGRRARQR